MPPYLSGGSTRLFEPVRGSLAWAGGPPTPQPAQPAVTGTFRAASGEATPGGRREAHSPGGPGPESRRDFSTLSGGLQSDAKEHQTYQVVTLASPARPIPQNRRPPRNGHRPEWAASDAGLGDTALNSSPCSVAPTRGRVAASAMRPAYMPADKPSTAPKAWKPPGPWAAAATSTSANRPCGTRWRCPLGGILARRRWAPTGQDRALSPGLPASRPSPRARCGWKALIV